MNDIDYDLSTTRVRFHNGKGKKYLRTCIQMTIYNNSPITDIDYYLVFCWKYRDKLTIEEIAQMTGRRVDRIQWILDEIKKHDSHYTVGEPINWHKATLPDGRLYRRKILYQLDDVLFLEEVGQILGMSHPKVFDLIHDGKLKGAIKKMKKKVEDGIEYEVEFYAIPYRKVCEYMTENGLKDKRLKYNDEIEV